MKIARPLANRDFRLLWSGQGVAQLGEGIFTVALAWQTLQLSRSAAVLSLVLFARALPVVLFALVGGAVTDRLPRRTVMLASDAVRGAAVATIASPAAAGNLEIVHLVVAGAVFEAAEAFFMPAMSAIYPDIVPADLLLQANALRSTSTTLAETLIGPAVGGIRVAAAGAAWAFGDPDQPRD